MSHMIEQVGADYFSRRFRGAFFQGPCGNPSVFLGCDEKCFQYKKIEGTYDNFSFTLEEGPNDFMESLAKFSVPTLGWRAEDKGKMLVYLNRNNGGYGRGTGQQNIELSYSPLTKVLMDEYLINSPSIEAQCLLAMRPKFLSLAEGVSAIREGEIIAFALSPAIAIMAKDDSSMQVMFRSTPVGTIDGKNNIKVSIPLVKQQMGEL